MLPFYVILLLIQMHKFKEKTTSLEQQHISQIFQLFETVKTMI